jgi:hypothetical protein
VEAGLSSQRERAKGKLGKVSKGDVDVKGMKEGTTKAEKRAGGIKAQKERVI